HRLAVRDQGPGDRRERQRGDHLQPAAGGPGEDHHPRGVAPPPRPALPACRGLAAAPGRNRRAARGGPPTRRGRGGGPPRPPPPSPAPPGPPRPAPRRAHSPEGNGSGSLPRGYTWRGCPRPAADSLTCGRGVSPPPPRRLTG